MTRQDMIDKMDSDLRAAIFNQPEIPAVILGNIRPQLEEKIDRKMVGKVKKIYSAGCGDSYFAGVCTELAFRMFAGVDMQPVEPLNFSRYLADYVYADSVLVAISNSGKVSRTIEAARRAYGKLMTWAVTDNPESGLSHAADLSLHPHIPPLASGGTGTRSYLSSLVSMYALSIHVGVLNAHLSETEAEKQYKALAEIGREIGQTLELSANAARAFATETPDDLIFFVGGGPNLGTAMFGAAKVLEALSLEGVAVELEEWAHLQFHATFENKTYILIAPPGRSYDRAVEQARGIKDAGGRLAVSVDRDDGVLTPFADHIFRVASPKHEVFFPLVYCIPLQLIALELAKSRNLGMEMRLDERRKEINFRQIFHSQIID